MTNIVKKIIQVTSVSPGQTGGAIVFGSVVGECNELRCKIDWKVAIILPSLDEFWEVAGEYRDHESYGLQLHVKICRPVKLPEERYIVSLLARHLAFKGFYFGPKKINALLDEFGETILVKYLNDSNVHALSSVIQPAIAAEVVRAWQGFNNEVDTVNFLLEHRFTPELARKVIYLCRDNTVERLKANPYALICFGDISKSIWRTVEACAKKNGFAVDDDRRLVGAVEHVLYKHLRRGHTAMPLDELIVASEKLLRTRKRVEKGVRLALQRRAACVLNSYAEPLIQLYGPAVIELQLERRIENLLDDPKQMGLLDGSKPQLRKLVDNYCSRECATGIQFDEKQREAIFMALNNRLFVLTGCKGTGKTTVLRAVTEVAKILRRETYLIVLTNEAKERARQAIGHRVFTIFAFLATVRKGAEDIKLNGNPLIIIDEASMVGTVLFNELLGLMDGKQFSLLTIGDTAQTSPAGFGLVWHRLAMMNGVPAVHLTKVHRQQSVLHDVAMSIMGHDVDGEGIDIPEWKGEAEGVYHVPADKKNLRQKLLLLKWIESQGGFPASQILTPHIAERMPDGDSKINRYLQTALTGNNDGIRLGLHWLRVGDPVIVSEDNYDLGLSNGTTGKLLGVDISKDIAAGVFTLEGHNEKVRLTTDELFEVGMKPAYAISIHKNQGCEYDATIITCVTDSPMVERSLIYTALTRAKKLCLIIGSMEVFQSAVKKPSRAETLCVGFFLSRLPPLAA